MSDHDKRSAYSQAGKQLRSLLGGSADDVAVMASSASVLHQAIPVASWTGFYRVVGEALLRIGPYQGPVACIEIPFDRGVCGAAARTGQTQLVDDVHAFEGHIACDANARSEIVVPIRNRSGRLVAVLDVDSHEPAAFGDVDREELESIAALLSDFLAHA